MDLGIFDHLDRQSMPVHEFYESRLRLLEKYDAAGFYSYHLAEHHATPLGLAPVPGIFLAAATQRTRRIRLGPCVYCLPLYDPLRLIEEVCMLDQLSHGRFDFGVGRGIVPYEMAYFNLHHLETEEIYREGLEVILQGLTSDVLDHRGPRYTYRKVPMILRPFQEPHPPLWYGLGHLAGAEWAATNRVNVIANNTADATRPLLDRYREVWQKQHGDLPVPRLGMGRHIVVAPTEAQAEAVGRPAYAIWYGHLTKLWRDFGALPDPLRARLRRGAAARHRDRGHARARPRGDRAPDRHERGQLLRLPPDVRRHDRGRRGRVDRPVHGRGHAPPHRAQVVEGGLDGPLGITGEPARRAG